MSWRINTHVTEIMYKRIHTKPASRLYIRYLHFSDCQIVISLVMKEHFQYRRVICFVMSKAYYLTKTLYMGFVFRMQYLFA